MNSHIETLRINALGNNTEKLKVIDYIASGERVYFPYQFSKINPITVVVFDRLADDDFIIEYLQDTFELDENEIKYKLSDPDAYYKVFLDAFANVVPYHVIRDLREQVMQKFRDSFDKDTKEVLVDKMIKFLERLSNEDLAKECEREFIK